jgi:hypothetical protein
VSDVSVKIRETEQAGVFELGLKKGQEIVLFQDENSVGTITPVAIPQGKTNFWGVKAQ